MGNQALSKKLPITQDITTNLYLSKRIALSGDIHPNPGPNPIKKSPKYKCQSSNLFAILVITLIFICHIKKLQSHNILNIKEPNNLRYNLETAPLLSLYNSYLKTKFKSMKFERNRKIEKKYIFLRILLMLAGNIEKNPGPMKTCNQCKQTIKQSYMTCESCKETYHFACNGDNLINVNVKSNKDVLWICPNENCQPNLVKQKINLENEIADIKFSHLKPKRMNKKAKKHSKISSKQKVNSKRKKEKQNNLWDELTHITPKQYLGKELCYKCHKEITKKSMAGECSSCQRRAHLKCQKITPKSYRTNKNSGRNRRFCKNCSTEEEVTTNKIKITELNFADKPEKIESLYSNKDELLIIHINARSVVNKIEEIKLLCYEIKPDILCITETWLNQSVPLNAMTPLGYKILRHDRSEKFEQIYGKTRGGGVAVLYKQELDIERKELFKEDYEENLWIQVKAKNSFLLGIFYRADYTEILKDSEHESKLEKYIQKAYQTYKNVILIGDFNADVKKENECPKGTKIQEIISTYGLEQIITKPTRIDNKSRKATIIDHIWINPADNVVLKSGTATGVSDHLAIYMKIHCQKPKKKPKVISIRDYKNYNVENYCKELRENLKESQLEKLINSKQVNSAMETLLEIIQQTSNKHAPIKEMNLKFKEPKIPWFNQEIIDKIKLKNQVLHDWHQYGLHEDKKLLKKMKNEINHLKTKLKKEYYGNELQKYDGDSKKMWKTLNEALGRTESKDPTEPTNVNKEKANSFNRFFATVGIEIQKKLQIKEHRTDFNNLEGFNFQPETNENVIKLINHIKPNVAVGYDNINSKMLKDSKEILAPWLTEIINISYEKNIFPDCMKVANIKPIYKENNKEEISNYRPISILPTISKIFERSSTDQLVKFLEQNDLITKCQHAYRKGHSTTTCLVEIINQLYRNIDEGQLTGLAKLDLSKAYDSISHSLLLSKLAELGLSEKSINYIKSYLTNRKQRTKFQNCISDIEVQSGIPQGSILGPILFVCFTNDLEKQFKNKCKIVSYADDTVLIVTAKEKNMLKTSLENVIKLAQDWYTKNSMKNNIGKTEILIMEKREQKCKFSIEVQHENENIIIKPKPILWILGIYVDQKLNWDKQIKHVKKRSMNAIINLSRARYILPEKSKTLIYNTLVTPHYAYADVVWGGCGKINSKKLQRTQNFALRTIKNKRKRYSSKELRNSMKYLDLAGKRKVHEAVFITKAMLNKTSKNVTDEYLRYLPFEKTRQAANRNLKIPEHKTSLFQKSPLYRTIKTWNEIPKSIEKDNPKILKKHYQNYLIKNQLEKP